ncbi:hypothetical protein KY328_00235 [Candidatus Woesearchaeota archaeon]|nr:hypothetical protein [Candidatus Woesearchaeota archaeon]MBW3021325.1 hypothetical protein [Candidatus Woesearchaeota archaeon]
MRLYNNIEVRVRVEEGDVPGIEITQGARFCSLCNEKIEPGRVLFYTGCDGRIYVHNQCLVNEELDQKFTKVNQL